MTTSVTVTQLVPSASLFSPVTVDVPDTFSRVSLFQVDDVPTPPRTAVFVASAAWTCSLQSSFSRIAVDSNVPTGAAKLATLSGPKGLSVAPNGDVYLADTESHSVRMIDVRHGTIELIAGTGERGDGPDGDPLNCRLARPHGVFVDADGSVFVGDSEAHRVRVLRARP